MCDVMCDVMCDMMSYPPNPITHVCSLTGKTISRNHSTHRSVTYFESCSGDFILRIWSSAQDYAELGLLLNPVVFLISAWQNSVRRKWFVLAVYQVWKGISAWPALKCFTLFIGAGGVLDSYVNMNILYMYTCQYSTYMYVNTEERRAPQLQTYRCVNTATTFYRTYKHLHKILTHLPHRRYTMTAEL